MWFLSLEFKKYRMHLSSDLKEYIHRSQYGYCSIFLWLTTHHREDQTNKSVDLSNCKVINLTILVCQEVQLQVELSLCSHFSLDWSHVRQTWVHSWWPDPYPRVFQIQNALPGSVRFQPPGDSEPWVENSRVSSTVGSQVLGSTYKYSVY